MSEPTVGQIFPRSGQGSGGGGAGEEVLIQPDEPSSHPDLWVDTDDSSVVAGVQEVMIQTSEPGAHPDLWVDTDAVVVRETYGNPRVLVELFSDATLDDTPRTDFVYQCNSGPLNLTLPAVTGNTNLYIIKKMFRVGAVTINAQPGELIEDSSSYSLTKKYSHVGIVSNGLRWITI